MRGYIMKFSEYKYVRPNFEEMKNSFNNLIVQFSEAETLHEQEKYFDEINKLRNNFHTSATLVSIRNSIDTNDKFYEAEKEFFNKTIPKYQEIVNDLYKALNASKFKKELGNKYGKYLFDKIEVELKTFKPEIIEDLIKENKLNTDR